MSNAESDFNVAESDLESNQKLATEGLVAEFTIKQKQAAVARAKSAYDLAQKQLASTIENEQSQLAPNEASVNQHKDVYDAPGGAARGSCA